MDTYTEHIGSRDNTDTTTRGGAHAGWRVILNLAQPDVTVEESRATCSLVHVSAEPQEIH